MLELNTETEVYVPPKPVQPPGGDWASCDGAQEVLGEIFQQHYPPSEDPNGEWTIGTPEVDMEQAIRERTQCQAITCASLCCLTLGLLAFVTYHVASELI